MINWIYHLFNVTPEIPAEPEAKAENTLPAYPLIAAPVHDNIVDFHTLRSLNADPLMKDEDGNTPLILAAAEDNHHAIEMLFNRGAKLEERGSNGYTALNVAAHEGKLKAAAMLISLGADLEARAETEMGTLEGGPTPLWTAVRHHDEDMVHLLISAGANVNVQDGNGNSVLSFAVHECNHNIVEMLVKAHADPLRVGPGGTSAVDWAKFEKNTAMVEILENKISTRDFVRQKRMQFFAGQELINNRTDGTEDSTNNHLIVTRPSLI